MVLCFRPTIVVLEGMFPGSDIAKAFIGAQPTLRVWKGNHRRELPYFVEGNFSPPPLSSISIMSTEHHYYNEIISSPILQSSVRGFQIRSNCDPQSIFLSMQSFAALESLAIQVPNVESTAFLAKMATVLPRLRRLTLDSQIIVRSIPSHFELFLTILFDVADLIFDTGDAVLGVYCCMVVSSRPRL